MPKIKEKGLKGNVEKGKKKNKTQTNKGFKGLSQR